MARSESKPLVHLELHTGDLARAGDFYRELCGWRHDRVETGCGDYWAMAVGGIRGGGIVECETRRSLWLPYVEVGEIDETTERARKLGARVVLEPREGPAGWRSVIREPAAGELALWQPKERRR